MSLLTGTTVFRLLAGPCMPERLKGCHAEVTQRQVAFGYKQLGAAAVSWVRRQVQCSTGSLEGLLLKIP